MIENKNQELLDYLDSICKKINEDNCMITVYGKVYDFNSYKGDEKGIYANFRLNYYKDASLNVYVNSYDWKKLQNVGVEVCNNDWVKVSGYLSAWKLTKDNKVELQIKAKTIYKDDSVVDYKCAPKDVPKTLPKNPKITLITNKNGAGEKDFLKKIEHNRNIVKIKRKYVNVVGDAALVEIPAAIMEANATNDDTNLICIVRGGGDSIALRYVFDNHIICDAIKNSTIPVLLGVGHAEDRTNADRASDAPFEQDGKQHRYFTTPTDLATYLNSHYYVKNTVVSSEDNKNSKLCNCCNKCLIAVILILLAYIFLTK